MHVPRVWLVLVCSALVSAPFARGDDEPVVSPSSSLAASAEALVDSLAHEEFAGAVARFDAAMKRGLPEPRLRAVWRSLTDQVGTFRQRLGHRVEKQGNSDVIFVTCQFRHAVLEAKVVFNPAGQVAGLYFAPPPKDS